GQFARTTSKGSRVIQMWGIKGFQHGGNEKAWDQTSAPDSVYLTDIYQLNAAGRPIDPPKEGARFRTVLLNDGSEGHVEDKYELESSFTGEEKIVHKQSLRIGFTDQY